jgi:hypothetical protein
MPPRKIATAPQRALANALERHRLAAGMEREQAAEALLWTVMKLYRIETARVTVDPADVLQMSRVYEISEADTASLVTLARQARKRGWWQGMSGVLPEGFSVHLELESAARQIRTYESQFVPGLLQTEEYARAMITARSVRGTPEQVERSVAVRMRRQQILSRDVPPPPHIRAVLDESVIRRVVGGRDVMRQQLTRLLELAADGSRFTLYVLPFTAGAHPAGNGSFTLLDPADPAFPVTASTDRPTETLIEDSAEAIRLYSTIFDHLVAAALGAAESSTLIAEAIRLL